jgi:alpha-ribazole phosphatase
MQLVMLRHGRTQANEERKYAGARLDQPLSENGRADALRCGTDEVIDDVFVSPMMRARQTAHICFPSARQVLVEGLREMDFGDFEGRSAQEMQHDAAYRAWVDSMCSIRCPGGENREEFTQRTVQAVMELLTQAYEQDDDQVIVVAHGGTILSVMDSLADDDRPYFEWQVGNAEGYYADVEFDGGMYPRLLNPTRFTTLAAIPFLQ